MLNWKEFASPEALAQAQADEVAGWLSDAIATKNVASLAVSGGKTPARFFEVLSTRVRDWSKVTVTLVDERFVPPTSDRSNEKLTRDALLRNEAAKAHFVPLYSEVDTPEAAAEKAEYRLVEVHFPLDVVVLGMGTNGHTASFFPDAENLSELLDPKTPQTVLAVHAASAGEPRLTLTLPRIAEARHLLLHIEGGDKRDVFDQEMSADTPRLPIRFVMDAATSEPSVYWAPSKESQR